MTNAAITPFSSAGIIINRHRQMDAILNVPFDRNDRGNLTVKNDVEAIRAGSAGTGLRSENHAVAGFELAMASFTNGAVQSQPIFML